MGLFKTLGLGMDAGSKREGAGEKPAETKETEKTAVETGRERVSAMKEGVSQLWDRMAQRVASVKDSITRKGKELFSRLLQITAEGAYGVIGGVEKGAKATVEAGKSAVEYTRE